jgi:hypothetical protein
MLLQAPGILKEADKLDDLTLAQRLQRGIELFQICYKLDQQLSVFADEMENQNNLSDIYWPVEDSLVIRPLDQGNTFPNHYAFADMSSAVIMILMWAMQTILWSGMAHLQLMICDLQKKFGVEQDLPGWNSRFMRFVVPGRKVLQSAAFFLETEASARIAIGPLVMVFDTFVQWPGHEKEVAYTKALLRGVEMRGMKIVKYLGVQEEKPREATQITVEVFEAPGWVESTHLQTSA